MSAFVIGIAGGSASGKTTFAQALAKNLHEFKPHVLHMDAYFKPEEQRGRAPGTINRKEYRDDNHPRSFELAKLAIDLAEAHKKHRVVIVEGILALHDEAIIEQLDLKLFIDCRPDERIVRRLRRNMGWGLEFDEIADVYLGLVRFRHEEFVEPSRWRADFVINGSQMPEKALEIITTYVKSLV